MWKVFPKMVVLKVVAILFSLILFIMLTIFEEQYSRSIFLSWSSLAEITVKAMSASVVCYIFVCALAKWGWIPFWKLPWLGIKLNKKLCPDLNGTWIGKTVSSYTDEHGNKIEKEVEMSITADFLSFDIELKSTDGYQESTVVQSEIYKDPRNGKFSISYIFESKVNQPLQSDDSKFDGAAKLDITFEDAQLTLKGRYWTNRNYQRNMQTAGNIKLTRTE